MNPNRYRYRYPPSSLTQCLPSERRAFGRDLVVAALVLALIVAWTALANAKPGHDLPDLPKCLVTGGCQ